VPKTDGVFDEKRHLGGKREVLFVSSRVEDPLRVLWNEKVIT